MTHRQRELLTFIKGYQAKHGGVSPSFDEMRDALGLASKSGVFRLIDALEDQRLVRRTEWRARSIEVLGSTDRLAAFTDAEIEAEHGRRFPEARVVTLRLHTVNRT